MVVLPITLGLILTLFNPASNAQGTIENRLLKLEKQIQAIEQNAEKYKEVIKSLTRQISVQQFYVEEQTRSSGDSGLKTTRMSRSGSRPYHNTYYSDGKIAAIHDHSNYENLIGMGELAVVLNGVEFRTRHNDYKLTMPSRKSKNFRATETIPYPDVPPEVLAQPTVEKQIRTMRLWFQAFKDQDYTKRDYRKYFKPVLCYLEGMWTEGSSSGSVKEPFKSDRHYLDAESYFDLQDKAKYTSGTGRKDISENYAFLPTTISRITEDGLPVYAQWNYNILCHPLKTHVPLNRIRFEDDLGPRVAARQTYEKARTSRYARFSLWPDMGYSKSFVKTRDNSVSMLTGSYLDKLMAEIPGKDNYPGNLQDNVFGATALKLNTKIPLNAAFYHRIYKIGARDAMNADTMFRSFSDANLYVAYNSRPEISPYTVKRCRKNRSCSPLKAKKTGCKEKTCSRWSHRVSFAIPLELIYLTPLHKWNPYNITYYKQVNAPQVLQTNGTYKRGGGNSLKAAYVGSSSNTYYRTPKEFFADKVQSIVRADTAYPQKTVIDSSGKLRTVKPSGIQIFLPEIDGVGVIRQRYPIMPLHQAGNAIFKELEALKDVTLKKSIYSQYNRDEITIANGTAEYVYQFDVNLGGKSTNPHYHTVAITETQLNMAKAGKVITAVTSRSAGHQHELRMKYSVANYSNGRSLEHLLIVGCDSHGYTCADGHGGWVISNESPRQFPPIHYKNVC